MIFYFSIVKSPPFSRDFFHKLGGFTSGNTVYKEYVSQNNEKDESDSEISNESDNRNKIKNKQFDFIKQTKEFIYIFEKENKITRDFHGIRDFYNLIKGIAREFRRLGSDADENYKLQIS